MRIDRPEEMKPGVYLNLYKDRGDFIIITNKGEIPFHFSPDLMPEDVNVDVHIGRRRVYTLIFKDLEYLGEL